MYTEPERAIRNICKLNWLIKPESLERFSLIELYEYLDYLIEYAGELIKNGGAERVKHPTGIELIDRITETLYGDA